MMKSLEEYMMETSGEVPHRVKCPCCSRVGPAFEFVVKDEEIMCSMCFLDEGRLEQAALEQAEKETKVGTWECDLGIELKIERNRRIEAARWAVDPLTSPLSTPCQAKFQTYIKKLHRMTVDFESPDNIVWPDVPALEYEDETTT